jgi:hypothetical protein
MLGDDGRDLSDADVMRADPLGRDQAAVEADQRLGQARCAGGHGLGRHGVELVAPGAGRREEKTSEISVCPVRRTLMQKHLFSSTKRQGRGGGVEAGQHRRPLPSAEIEVIAETVTPPRPAGPSVVTTETEAADRLIPSRKAARSVVFSV